MALRIDFNALKAQTMGSGNDEEAVTVDTRGLISKVLARYSGKWTVLREMIQNAADADATKVTIKFETLPSTTVPIPASVDQTALIKHTISHHTLRRLLVSNNGTPFSEKDWARLKRIADGNPDETKIGAFGVGFYSVFDDCEEPFVSSGKEAMAFYWKGNALFTRRLQLTESSNTETTFVLDYRNDTSPVPSLLQLCQFLSTSLTFVGLECIELWLDDWNLLRLTKKTAPSISLSIPRDIDTKTPQGLMKIVDVAREVAQIDASWMRIVEWNPNASVFRLDGLRDTTSSLRSFFFSKLTGQNPEKDKLAKTEKHNSVSDSEDMTKSLTASVFLHTNTASIQSSVSSSLSSELERATRKPPPKKTTIAVLTPSYDISMASGASASQSEVLASILPSKAGRIFIGFPTQQTTGLNAHISAPSVIPTVERESIDLNTRYISKWNTEMLRAAGIVCRVAWAAEMASIKAKLSSVVEKSQLSKTRKDDIVHVLPETIHTANQFVFRESTPLSQLGQLIEDGFWTCNKKASIEVLSTCGIIQSHQARIAPKDLSFMDTIPVLPDEFVSGAKDFVRKLTDFGLVTDITVSDIKRELESSTLQSKQVVEFLSWLGRKAASAQLDIQSITSLLSVAVANDEDDNGTTTRLLVFADITSFLNPQRIPADLPLPPSVLPFKYTKSLPKHELEALGWTELQLTPWLRWIVTNSGNRNSLPVEHDITRTFSFAAQVLPVLSKQFEGLSHSSKQAIISLLQSHTVIPTKLGMKYPAQTYFPSVRLFDDLPVVHGLNGVKEKFLANLGVRKTVELSVIFERLLDAPAAPEGSNEKQPKWSHVDLMRYLASVRDDIPTNDIQKLKKTGICTAESPGDQKTSSQKRYKISDLYEPNASLRSLELPIIEWPGRYEPASNEAKFLYMMGLRRYPSAPELIQLMAKANLEGNRALHLRALAYYISEYHANGYGSFDASAVDVPFLPIEGTDELSPARKCFTDDGATLFDFRILRQDLQAHASKFGVRQHPPVTECLDRLIRRPPSTKRDARVLFKYLSGRVSEISVRDIDRVCSALIVPVGINETVEKGEKVRRVAPRLCYLGDGEDYKDIFDFVDFGQEANLFLMAVGSKREPTKPELAQILVKEPARISSTFQSADKYLKLLRTLSESLMALKKDKELFQEMKRAPFLLASKDISSLAQRSPSKDKSVESDDDDYDEDQSIKEWTLASAKDIVVVDDFQSFNLFKEHVLAAPQEEALENFYLALGAIPLSTIVEERASWGSMAADQRPATKLQKLIRERTRLYLHDQSPDTIRHDVRWLEKNLQVQVVNTISLTRSLMGRRVSLTQKRSAVVTQLQSRAWTLWICPGKFDFYEISQALVHLILYRPKLHTTLTLEMLLKTDLLELKTRGYNVERILKQKAQEAKVAEDKRQQQLEGERRQLQEREAAWAKEQTQSRQVEEENSQAVMPGDFPDSPTKKNDRHDSRPQAPEPVQEQRPRGLFANLTRRLGLENGRNSNLLSQGPSQPNPVESTRDSTPPPPYSTEDPKTSRPEQPAVNSPHKLHSELISAIQACRPHGSSGVYSRPETSEVTETKSYCDEKPSHELDFIATLSCGINLLFTKNLGDRSNFLAKNGSGINSFASVLIECADIFSLSINTMNVFYDPGGRTIAFNRAGSIFCNYFYFQQLHETNLLQSQDTTEALVYWWVILCHELAHNLVGDHSSAHSYYTEGFVAHYFPKIATKLAAPGRQAPSQAAS
ncbi:histidine kinase-like ATPase domain-containing protein [Aspergillus ruber CBS 135680]|uniref:Putative HATPase_c domain protein n=1 Tax=Aspergillus ruber (strain CBS 135680) TaxID=1388766 RepID=A0A017SKE2_ASPRC|nr:putative HATPase_c domain protein [Aspergillus ruber CBS 135680]EYE97241.1 putative HATPase_c domain protein [Aspergillus ruber CBS 135680]